MISFIRGTVADLTENSAIIESNCIGFEINMTGNALAQLHIGQEVKLHTYFQVREDAMVLYGFFNKDDLQVFKLLLGVNGVGPKAALGVLAGITADELRFAVLSDDVKTLSKAPGIGKKTAQKLILEIAKVIRLGFLQQNAFHKDDTCVSLEKQFKMMDVILYLYKTSRKLVAMGMPMSVLKAEGIFEKVIAIKYDVPNDNLQLLDLYKLDIDDFYNRVIEKNA